MGFDLSGGGECIPLLYPSCIAHRQGEEHSLLSPPAEGGWDFTLQYWEIFLAQTFEKATVAVKSWVFFTKSVDSLRYEIVHSFLYLPFPRTGLTTTVRCTALVPRTWRPSGLRLSSGCRAPAPRRGPPSAAPPPTPQTRLSGEAGR